MSTRFPAQWQLVGIRGIIQEIERGIPDKLFDTTFNYIDIASVDNESKSVGTQLERQSQDAPSRARQLVRAGDVLISTVRPRLNAVAVVPEDLEDAVASTGFCVLRPKPEIVLADYLFAFCTSNAFISQLASRERGASYPAVTDDDVYDIQIPLPPLNEQRRVVEIMKHARDIRRFGLQADELANQLIPAIFNKMFGDPIGEVQPADRIPLSAFVSEMIGGKSLSEDPSGTKYRVVKVSAVTWGKFQPEESKYVDDNYTPPLEHFVQRGDLLFSRANTEELVGATVLVERSYPDILLSDKIWRFVWRNPDEVDRHYMLALFQHPSVRREISNNASGTGGSMKNISKGKLMSIRVTLAPYEMQRRFGDAVREISSLYLDDRNYRELIQSLLAYAFTGELTASWREENREQLAPQIVERDQWLREHGVKYSVAEHRIQVSADQDDGRQTELNREQQALFEQVQKSTHDDNSGVFTLSALKLADPIDQLPVDVVRRHLDVLAARGLIKAVSRRSGAGGSVSLGFGNVYRLPLRDEGVGETEDESDFARLSELDRLSKQGRAISVSVSDSLRFSDSATAPFAADKGTD